MDITWKSIGTVRIFDGCLIWLIVKFMSMDIFNLKNNKWKKIHSSQNWPKCVVLSWDANQIVWHVSYIWFVPRSDSCDLLPFVKMIYMKYSWEFELNVCPDDCTYAIIYILYISDWQERYNWHRYYSIFKTMLFWIIIFNSTAVSKWFLCLFQIYANSI